MQRDTDLSEFLAAGYRGLNFIFVGGSEHNHQSTDTVENLDKRTLYHYILTTKAMTQMGAGLDMSDLDAGYDGLYFPFLPGNIIIMPESAARLLSGIIFVLTIIWTFFSFSKKDKFPEELMKIRKYMWFPLVLGIICLVVFPACLQLFAVPLLFLLLASLCCKITPDNLTGLVLHILYGSICGFALLLLYVPIFWLFCLLLGNIALLIIMVFGSIPISCLIYFCFGFIRKFRIS